MNEHIIQLLQNEDDNNRLLGVYLAVGDGWSVEDIFKWLYMRFDGDYYKEWTIINYELQYVHTAGYEIWNLYDPSDNPLCSRTCFDTKEEYQAKFIELLLN